MSKEKVMKIIWILLSVIIGVLIIWFIFSKQEMEKCRISINDNYIEVYIARNLSEQAQGLSGIELDEFDQDGMLFVFNDTKKRYFWMNEMEFDLDIIWIQNDRIVKIEEGIRSPINADQDIYYMDSEPFDVDAVLELPAGEVDLFELKLGDLVIY